MTKRMVLGVLLAAIGLVAGPRPGGAPEPAPAVEASGSCTATPVPPPTRHLQPWEEGCTDAPALARQ